MNQTPYWLYFHQDGRKPSGAAEYHQEPWWCCQTLSEAVTLYIDVMMSMLPCTCTCVVMDFSRRAFNVHIQHSSRTCQGGSWRSYQKVHRLHSGEDSSKIWPHVDWRSSVWHADEICWQLAWGCDRAGHTWCLKYGRTALVVRRFTSANVCTIAYKCSDLYIH